MHVFSDPKHHEEKANKHGISQAHIMQPIESDLMCDAF